MTTTKKTSTMMWPLEEPNGWYLSLCSHEHTKEGDHYIPVQDADGPWYVTFKKTVGSITTVTRKGRTIEQAWSAAYSAAEEFGE